MDQPFQAVEALKEAAKRFPKSGQIDYQVAQIYYSLEKPQEAYQSLVTAVANAELTLNTVVAVRDRVINAYNDIIKMSI